MGVYQDGSLPGEPKELFLIPSNSSSSWTFGSDVRSSNAMWIPQNNRGTWDSPSMSVVLNSGSILMSSRKL